ncbi:uncharacterized protein LOC142167941 [Nicotiana tabacum]|uniref:Uncharacterized protein LOC142167941 n=3 Tax=Nicotiana TaxID=4085 RepID=A0AC58SI21_TOBAC|nr:PREDICTED: uncharacterized protein LOC104246841 [Nicotiana sylvestris]XP_016448705.1 PREDICTED: uncharacterized protein LOC107773794 [Nicotiana tabacum]
MEDYDSMLIEEKLLNGVNIGEDHGWQTVSYQKKNKKQSLKKQPEDDWIAGVESSGGDVFRSIEEHAEERRKRIVEAQKLYEAENSTAVIDNGNGEEYGSSDGENAAAVSGGAVVEKKSKPKKAKKPKVTVAEAAAKIDNSDLVVFLVDISASYEKQEDIQLMRFADYFGRAFAKVSSSQFPWMKILRESAVEKMVDIPLSQISEDVYKTSIDWLNQRSFDALGSFVLWSLDSILADLVQHQGASKGSKKVVQQVPSKSQVAMFVVLAMVLRRKPDVLISLLPIMNENAKYQGQDKLQVMIWAITQACQGDLIVGLFMWVHFLLPMLSSKSNSNPQARDLILQLAERIVSLPKARAILMNGAVRKGERVVPPSALEVLMRITFPSPSARIKATERFEAVYPILKEVALVASPGSKAMKQITQQIMLFAIKAVAEGVPELTREASELSMWCLTQNPDCYKLWDNVYLDNVEASLIIIKKLSSEFKVHSAKGPGLDPLKVALNSIRLKSEKALASVDDAARQASLKEVQKHSKILLGRLSHGNGCMKALLLIGITVAVGAAFVSKDLQSLDLKKLLAVVSKDLQSLDLKKLLADLNLA